MARALAEEQEFSAEQELPESSFSGLETPAASVKLNTPAPAPAPAPAPVVTPVVMAAPIAAPLVAPAGERSDDVLDKAQSHINAGRLNQAAALLEEGVSLEPERSDLRLKLMEVYGQQGDRDAFVAQERQLVANGDNFAKVEALKSRFPAMAVVAAGGLAAAAVAAELDAQYVKELLQDEPQAPETAADDLDTAFDLSLDDLDNITPVDPAPAVEPEAPVELDAFPAEDDLSFASVLQEQTEMKDNLDDLSDFDLDMDFGAEPSPATLAEDDFLLDLDDGVKDLPPVETPVVADVPQDDLELPADFDLSLADEMDSNPSAEPDAFSAELDDVNAELDRLSQSMAEPSFTEADAAMGDDLGEDDFDFLAGTDEAATKLDLAQAYIDMGDADGARDILNEVLTEGDEKQRGEAKEMLSNLA
jgi:pilus assembly protein FimV